MNRLLVRITNQVMGAFVGSGVSLDEEGQLCLPDGLSPERVHRFIELCMDRRFGSPREAMTGLFHTVGVEEPVVELLDGIIDAQGSVDFKQAARHTRGLASLLPAFGQIPSRFRDFLVSDLGLASQRCKSLEQAVGSARRNAAKRIGCAARWEEILRHEEPVRALAAPWRERLSAA